MGITDKIASGILTFMMVVMAALAVFPHHHHASEVCFSESHCNGENKHDCPAEFPDAAHHRHDMPRNDSDCGVIHTYLLPDMKYSGNGKAKDNGRQHLLQPALRASGGSVVLDRRADRLRPCPENKLPALLPEGALSLRAPPIS